MQVDRLRFVRPEDYYDIAELYSGRVEEGRIAEIGLFHTREDDQDVITTNAGVIVVEIVLADFSFRGSEFYGRVEDSEIDVFDDTLVHGIYKTPGDKSSRNMDRGKIIEFHPLRRQGD